MPRRPGTAAVLGLALASVMPVWAAGDEPTLITVNPHSAYPEGPTVVGGVLYYAEMGNDRVMRFDGASNSLVWTGDGCWPTAVAALGDGSLAVLCHRAGVVARISPAGELLGLTDRDADGRPLNNPNAAAADGAGGIYFSSSGTFAAGAPATGAVFHLDSAGRLSRAAGGIHYANGVAVSPDGKILYVSEHLGRRVLAFDIVGDDGLMNRRTFVALDDLVGNDPARTWEVGPDGLAVDRDGNVVIAEYGAGRLLVVDKAGRLLATLPVPERYVTSSAFNADQTRLYITAPASLISPDSGAVYAVDYPIPGMP